MYIKKLHVENLKAFAQASLEFSLPTGTATAENMPNVTILLGNNGAGKTTTLKAIALAILAPVLQSSGYVPYALVRRQAATASLSARKSKTRAAHPPARVRAEVVLHPQDRHGPGKPAGNCAARIERQGSDEFIEPEGKNIGMLRRLMTEVNSPAFFLVGYGATRRVEPSEKYDSATRGKTRRPRYQRVSGLFEEGSTMAPLASYLPRLRLSNPGRFEQVVHLINRLLPAPVRFTGDMEDGEYLFETGSGLSVPYPALSDGYRSYIGWIGDMLKHVCDCCPRSTKLVNNRGLVMVDEVDLHLHPAWQRQVVPMLAAALPNLQFIFTTHSPIVTGTVQASNLVVLDGTPAQGAAMTRATENVHGHTADEILLSSYFGLPSTRAIGFSRRINRLTAEAGKDPRAALAVIRALSSNGLPESLKPRPLTATAATVPTASPAKKKTARKAAAKKTTVRKTARRVK